MSRLRTSDQIFRTGAGLADAAWISAPLLGYTVFLFAPQVLNDGDTYSHLATGEWILSHRLVPATDPFSYAFSGAPWVAHEWLSELVMAIAYRLGGWSGLLILFGAVTALAGGLLTRYLTRCLDPLPAAVTLLLVAACISPGLLARPHILVLPISALWTIGLLDALSRKRVPWPLLPLMLVWANLHGSFIFGILLICPLALEAMLDDGAAWHRLTFEWILFFVASTALACATPHGWRGLAFPFHLLGMRQLSGIGEWHPTDFGTLQPIELALMALLYVCFTRGARVSPLRLITLLALLHLALRHSRHQMLAGVVGALILAEPLARSLNATQDTRRSPQSTQALQIACACVLALLLTTIRLAWPAAPMNSASSPISAIDHVPPALAAEPVLNDYAFGGYLIFRGIHPFIDGRADLYGDGFLRDYASVMRSDRARLMQTLADYNIRWTILPARSRVAAVLDTLPGWFRLYADPIAVVHTQTRTP